MSKKKTTVLNKLIVIGNGFDLASGQATSVFDFIGKTISFNRNYYFQSAPYKLDFLSYLYFECAIVENEKWRSFLKVDGANDWKDFELILNHVLFDEQIFSKLKDIYEKNIKDGEDASTDSITASIHGYFVNYYREHINDCVDDFMSFLSVQVERFEKDFRKYLSEIDKDPLTQVKKKLLYDKIVSNSNPIAMIFNYTSASYTDRDPRKNFAIHGTVGACNMVIGVDPTANNEFKNCSNLYEKLGDKIKFTKTYKRLKNVYFGQEFILRDNIEVVAFYGHSLGEQDYSYFQSIFDHYSLYDGKLVLEFCYSEYDEEDKSFEYNQLISRITKLINKYGETLENKDHGKNLLNKLMLEGRIKVREIDKNEIFTAEKINRLSQLYFGKDLIDKEEK